MNSTVSTLICSDSFSTITALKSLESRDPTIKTIQQLLLKNRNIKVSWVKAHAGLAGNEIADHLAKDAVNLLPTINSPKFPLSYIKMLSLKEQVKRWQRQWDTDTCSRNFYNVFKKVSVHPKKMNRAQVLLITGHGPFPTYRARFKLKNSSRCRCGEIGSPNHYTSVCPLTYEFHIQNFSGTWEQNILDPGYRGKATQLITYLTENSNFIQNTSPEAADTANYTSESEDEDAGE